MTTISASELECVVVADATAARAAAKASADLAAHRVMTERDGTAAGLYWSVRRRLIPVRDDRREGLLGYARAPLVGARDDWVRLSPPGFRVELSYPAVTPNGHVVERTEEQVQGHPIAGDFERVHLTSGESGGVYVELARFPDRTPQDEYDQHRPYLEARFGPSAVTALTETRSRGRPAWTYSIRWADGERAVLLFHAPPDTYRVIFDPRSLLNSEVIDTLAVED